MPAIILEQRGTLHDSESLAKRQRRMFITFEELPIYVKAGLIRSLRETKDFAEKGYVWFHLGGVGTDMLDSLQRTSSYRERGYLWSQFNRPSTETRVNLRIDLRINYKGRTTEEFFRPPKQGEWKDLPFHEQARFYLGTGLPSLFVHRFDLGVGRLVFYGNAYPEDYAPVTVLGREATVSQVTHAIDYNLRRG